MKDKFILEKIVICNKLLRKVSTVLANEKCFIHDDREDIRIRSTLRYNELHDKRYPKIKSMLYNYIIELIDMIESETEESTLVKRSDRFSKACQEYGQAFIDAGYVSDDYNGPDDIFDPWSINFCIKYYSDSDEYRPDHFDMKLYLLTPYNHYYLDDYIINDIFMDDLIECAVNNGKYSKLQSFFKNDCRYFYLTAYYDKIQVYLIDGYRDKFESCEYGYMHRTHNYTFTNLLDEKR